ncbi:MAG: glycosyltransferase family 2 protein [Eggerthellaceae bacterium]|nr:glycosyltransferase family 2 protein [Eggerthellaceae bacterium]
MKTISFAVPCYNSADYMDKCIESLLACDNGTDDIEILIVDDGSTKDNTAQKADEWHERYPETVYAIHKENGGHGSAVNTGLEYARGRYFKVVDSDDWLDADAMRTIMPYLRRQSELQDATDLVIGNYVYEKVYEGTRTPINYRNIFPVDRECTWDEIGRFKPSQYLLMHSVIYRTEMLRDIGLKLPEHCFYVDNIFVYVPLPAVKTIRYFDVDMYRYFIGREGQSVNEDIMKSRIDQQLRITRVMIDSVDLDEEVASRKLRKYMENYLSMMMCICSVFLRMINTPEAEGKRTDIWAYLKARRPKMYGAIRRNILNFSTNVPSEIGRRVGLGGYHVAQKIFKFN